MKTENASVSNRERDRERPSVKGSFSKEEKEGFAKGWAKYGHRTRNKWTSIRDEFVPSRHTTQLKWYYNRHFKNSEGENDDSNKKGQTRRHWTEAEKEAFVKGYEKYSFELHRWKLIHEDFIPSRTPQSISHYGSLYIRKKLEEGGDPNKVREIELYSFLFHSLSRLKQFL